MSERDAGLGATPDEVRALLVGHQLAWDHCQFDFDIFRRELETLLATGGTREATPPNGYWRLRVEHARKQGDADGFQKGWHAALSRIREGDSVDTLADLVPQPTAVSPDLRGLSQRWRAQPNDTPRTAGFRYQHAYDHGAEEARRKCADELDAALQASGEPT